MTNSARIAAGSIQLEKVIITSEITKDSIDLKAVIWEMNIYESINQPFLMADLLIGDSLALASVLPIVGQEKVEIKFKTPELTVTKSVNVTMRVTKVMEVRRSNSRTTQYIISLASEEYLNDLNTKISKAFLNQKISDMVKSICKDYLKSPDSKMPTVEETDANRTIVVPNMSPSRAISFLSKEGKSSSSVYKASNYTFFESCDGFQFTPIDKLILMPYPSLRNEGPFDSTDRTRTPEIGGNSLEQSQQTIDYYYATEKDVGRDGVEHTDWRGGVNSKKPFELQKINNFRFLSLFNNDLTTVKGGFENRFMYLNPSLSLFEERKYEYFENFDDLNHTTSKSEGPLLTEKNLNISKSGDSLQIFTMTNKGENDTSILDQKPDFFHLNVGSMGLLEDIVVDLDIPGDTDRRAGDIIRIQFPEFGATDDVKGKLNQFVSGDYLVVSLKHHYNPENGYRCFMQCVKNCYEKDLDGIKEKIRVN